MTWFIKLSRWPEVLAGYTYVRVGSTDSERVYTDSSMSVFGPWCYLYRDDKLPSLKWNYKLR